MNDEKPIQLRWIELLVALCFVGVATLVIVDSLRTGNAWGSDGPQPGYFPFYIGCLMLAGAGWVILQTCLRWRSDGGRSVFTEARQWRLVLKMLVPTGLYLLVLAVLGIYLASLAFISGFMVWQGRYAWGRSLAVGLLISATLFLLFEIWFQLPLPKGPVEQWLGY
ncbi:MAG: tripartite tricarboxylate transporter TctB family protein [Actinomycetales bacterium]|nr:tripartite tricarboxylate transporter TctB family protein [Actinomycetales bacterium]